MFKKFKFHIPLTRHHCTYVYICMYITTSPPPLWSGKFRRLKRNRTPYLTFSSPNFFCPGWILTAQPMSCSRQHLRQSVYSPGRSVYQCTGQSRPISVSVYRTAQADQCISVQDSPGPFHTFNPSRTKAAEIVRSQTHLNRFVCIYLANGTTVK